MYILPHFLAYSKYYFCPGPQLQDLGASKQTEKYFIGGVGGRYLYDYVLHHSDLGVVGISRFKPDVK